jgi:hypothetical protein
VWMEAWPVRDVFAVSRHPRLDNLGLNGRNIAVTNRVQALNATFSREGSTGKAATLWPLFLNRSQNLGRPSRTNRS